MKEKVKDIFHFHRHDDYENDNCVNFFSTLKVKYEVFQNLYLQYSKYNLDELDSDTIKDIKQFEILINKTIDELKDKIQALQITINQCKYHKKQKIVDEVRELKKTLEEREEIFIKRGIKTKEKIESFKEEEIKKERNVNNKEDGEEEVGEEECFNPYGIGFNEENLVLVENYLEDDSNFLGVSEKEFEEIMALKKELKELMEIINERINQADVDLEEIETHVQHSYQRAVQSKEQLKQAALERVKGDRVKYAAIFGGILCALGTIVPGIGNIIGAAVGTGIGLGLAKMEKHAINRIDKRDKKNKK